ncbi:MAG: VWA domain-containing protein [Planctomycetes bacterium]|nr:VWA domain-containing protein [Planctomycetota bacterium]
MSLLYPELLLLGLPIGWLLWHSTDLRSIRFILRMLTGLCLLLALASPYGGGSIQGRDLVLVVDRSRSMPAGTATRTIELVDLAREGMKTGDRLAIVTFGSQPMIEQGPQTDPVFEGFQLEINPDGSNLTAALDRALTLIPENRPGSILLYSDGEHQGELPETVARRAAARGISIDVRTTPQASESDALVERLDLPPEIAVGEPFQFQAWVRTEQAGPARYTLFRGEQVIASGDLELQRGLQPLRFRDRGQMAGMARYRLQIDVAGDRLLENNAAIGVTRVTGSRPLLVINSSGQAGRLVNAMRSAGLTVEVTSADTIARKDPVWLEGYRGFVIENVAASKLGKMLPAISRQVEDLGAGLMITGGQASFGVGGYYRSALDPLLPVSMELRVEHRKMGLAIAFVLDRSGSMGVGAGSGTKMDLANAGTMEAIRLLSPLDEATVIAVDSSPTVVVPLAQVDDPEAFADRVSGIRAGGGGIYTYTGLSAAAQSLEFSARANRHIVLFADASDAEEPGQYVALLNDLTNNQATTASVVALGQDTDSDAAFLQDIASRGGGQIYFSEDPADLPRLFAQDTMLAARSSFVDLPTSSRIEAGLLSIAALPPGPWLGLLGYNLCYLRPGASLGILTKDEYAAPVVATMQAGLGRTAAFTAQVDGKYGIREDDWAEAAKVLVTLSRWISGQEPPAQYYASIRREGREAVLNIEVDPELGEGKPLTTRMVDPTGRSTPVDLIPVSENRFEARMPLATDGIYRFAAATESGEVVPIDPVAAPYSPEFEARSDRNAGERVLGALSRLSGGRMNVPASELWRGNRGGSATRSWINWFALAGLSLMLLEIAWRRLFEGSLRWQLRLPQLRRAHNESASASEEDEAPVVAKNIAIPAAVDLPRSKPKKVTGATKSEDSDGSIDAALKGLKKKRRR